MDWIRFERLNNKEIDGLRHRIRELEDKHNEMVTDWHEYMQLSGKVFDSLNKILMKG